MIKEIDKNNIPECVTVIKESFKTVADAFGFTPENAPGFTAFATDEARLLQWMDEQHRPMYSYFEGDKLVGYYNLLILDNGECELGSLCVLPEYRHSGIGEILLNDALEKAKTLGCRVFCESGMRRTDSSISAPKSMIPFPSHAAIWKRSCCYMLILQNENGNGILI